MLYLADIIGGVSFLFGTTGAVLAISTVIMCINEERIIRTPIILSCILLLISAALPSKDFVYKALAISIGEQVVKSEAFSNGMSEVTDTTKKVLSLVNKKLDEELNETKKDK